MKDRHSVASLNRGQQQVIADKIANTIRILELLGFSYRVSAPKNTRQKGNKSPRVVYVDVGKSSELRIYNSYNGYTWANSPDGEPIQGVKTIEDLYQYLKENFAQTKR